MSKELEAFSSYVKNFFEKNNMEYEDLKSVAHQNHSPFDSFDRLYALYLIDKKPQIIQKAYKFPSEEDCKTFLDNLDEDAKKEMKALFRYSYDNYEREGMPDTVAYGNLLYEATKGKESVLKSTYGEGGWFGSS